MLSKTAKRMKMCFFPKKKKKKLHSLIFQAADENDFTQEQKHDIWPPSPLTKKCTQLCESSEKTQTKSGPQSHVSNSSHSPTARIKPAVFFTWQMLQLSGFGGVSEHHINKSKGQKGPEPSV